MDYISAWEHNIDSRQIFSIDGDRLLEVENHHNVHVFLFAIEDITENEATIKLYQFGAGPEDAGTYETINWEDGGGLEISSWIVRKQIGGKWLVVEKKTTYIE